MKLLKAHFSIILIILLSIGLIFPLLQKGYYPSHDGEWAVVRLGDMYREVKDHQFPPRFSGNLNAGYGYPLFEFAYPLPYYLGLPFFFLHFGLVNSIKLLFALTVPLSGIMMFLAARQLWKKQAGALLSAILYMYLPYRMVDLYVRGSLGESLASVFFPSIIYFLTKLARGKSYLFTGLLAVSFAGLILTHNIMAVLFGIIIGVYVLFLLKTQKREYVLQMILGLGLGVMLSAFFWLPALAEKNLILLSQIPIADRSLYYVNFSQLLFPSWGYGTPTEANPFSYQLGLAQTAIFLVVIIFFLKKARSTMKGLSSQAVFIGLSIFFLFLLFPISRVVWEKIPLLKEINYPWTSLLPLGFLMSLLAGSIDFKGKIQNIVIVGISLVSIVLVLPYAMPKEHVDRGDGYYFTNDATTTSSHELMPLWVKEIPTIRPSQKVEIVKGTGEVEGLNFNSHKATFNLHLATDATVRFNTIYYPGWHWYSDGREVSLSYKNSRGVMEASLPQGDHTIRIALTETPLRMLADSISLLGAFLVLLLIVVSIKRSKV